MGMSTITALQPVLMDRPRYRAIGPDQIEAIADRYGIAPELAQTARRFSQVLPFRTNSHVLEELIDWSRIPDDPMFQLVFPQPGMLPAEDDRQLAELLERHGHDSPELAPFVMDLRRRLNPHPAGQMELNVPQEDGETIPGTQHKYRETVLFFPSNGQTCHAYCTYCFRWPQFVGDADLRFASPDAGRLVQYLEGHPDVTDVLITGGDPLIMSTQQLRRHVEPLLAIPTVRTIRLGTKSITYWPQRFTTDNDADDVLRLFESVVASGRTLAVMAHIAHPREIEPELARQAIARIRATGAVIYTQAPIVAHVNDASDVWAQLWRTAFSNGIVPYYMFVARDTGPHEYFKVPLARAHQVYREALQQVSGLARTARGPVMSATPGKGIVDGEMHFEDQRYLQLRFLQARQPELVGRPFFARWSDTASWLDEVDFDASVPPDIAAVLPRR
jgi:KamA family protein